MNAPTPGLPTPVQTLVRVIARAFYRDEYVVVLDHLARSYFLRDDDLRAVFHLADKQVRQILRDLQTERLVCCDERVSERARRVGRQMDADAELKVRLLRRVRDAGGCGHGGSSGPFAPALAGAP